MPQRTWRWTNAPGDADERVTAKDAYEARTRIGQRHDLDVGTITVEEVYLLPRIGPVDPSADPVAIGKAVDALAAKTENVLFLLDDQDHGLYDKHDRDDKYVTSKLDSLEENLRQEVRTREETDARYLAYREEIDKRLLKLEELWHRLKSGGKQA